MSLDSPFRCLVLSATVAVTGGAALLGLLPGSGSPSAPTAAVAVRQLAVAAPSEVTAPVAAHVVPEQPAAPDHVPAPAPETEAEAVVREQAAAGLECAPTAQGLPLCVHGEDAEPAGAAHVPGTAGGSTGTSGAIGCYGDGTSGARVRAVYARPQSAPDRYAASLSSVQGWAAGVSRAVDASAARTGGRRHVRFATTPGTSCSLTVLNVVLPDAAFSSFRATIDALEARGFNAPASKYLVWADAAGVCGMATTYADDRPGPDNLNNGSYPSYARVDRKCWGKVETHELVHMLGGVQRSARNATAGFHCNDGHDVMCYDDGTAGSKQKSVCAKEWAQLLDCRSDDYFSVAPAKGSYLATHWNTARSSFLAPALNEAAAASPRPASPAPSASASPKPSSKPSSAPLVPPVQLPPLPSLPAVLPSPLPTTLLG